MELMLRNLRRRRLRQSHPDRARVLAGVLERLRVSAAPSRRSLLWTDAIYGWGNEEWAAEERYLAEVVQSAERCAGPILECGSGLTTLLIGAVATRRALRLHSLENSTEWHARVTQALRDHGVAGVTVHLTPLRDFGAYEWYDVQGGELPDEFSLVVCDGPPASTRGGRGGMLPRMRGSLVPGCCILLDDASRPAERALVDRWREELGGDAKLIPGSRGFARIVIGGS